MARSRTPKFDASEIITNEIIRIIERGVLPWRKPWTAGGSCRPLRVGGEPYQGVNNFLLTMRTVMAGHSSPFWMTLPQANALDAKVRKGEKSSVVVYYGQSRKDAGGDEHDRSDGDDHSEEARIFRFQKSYRVFNACQIDGLPDSFFPDPEPAPEHPPSEPIPHMQA
ncbi:ArdC family protein, partial [Sulfitobacter pontiacus]